MAKVFKLEGTITLDQLDDEDFHDLAMYLAEHLELGISPFGEVSIRNTLASDKEWESGKYKVKTRSLSWLVADFMDIFGGDPRGPKELIRTLNTAIEQIKAYSDGKD